TSDFRLENGEYWVRSFWEQDSRLSRSNQPIWKQSVAPHGVVLLAMRKEHPGCVQYLGSDIHISQGLEVKEWEVSEHEIRCVLDPERQAQGTVELFIPHHITDAWLEREPVNWRVVEEDIYRFSCEIQKTSTLTIRYDQANQAG
ncbi:MAG: hypothetical protein MUO76_06000, partial [Anaerolineaceae bacterium]|nr:hypothetical protein [Anaerolineaceae bacterium]